jgi:uncharacterized protein
MFSLQRLLSKGGRFFDLLEAGTEEAHQSVRALVELINTPHNGQSGQSLDKLITSHRQEKQIHEQITALLCSTLITPLEREDIESLSNGLSRITKGSKKFAQRLLLSQPQIRPEMFGKQIELIERAVETLSHMVRQLRRPHLDKIEEENTRLRRYEGEADKLMLDLLKELYGGQYDALQMIVMRDLFELLEKVIDRCRDAGNIVFQIVLRHC